MDAFYEHTNANIHRGIHALAEEATEEYEAARAKTPNYVGGGRAPDHFYAQHDRIHQSGRVYLGTQIPEKGDLVVLTEMEHHSNLVPWYMLAEEKELRIEFVRVHRRRYTGYGSLSADLLEQEPQRWWPLCTCPTCLGTINPAKEMIRDAHDVPARSLIVDGAQSVPHFGVNLSELDPDFYAFSGHKMCGPTGIGVLYGQAWSLLNAMPPFLGGGDMIKKVTFEGFSTNDVPYKFEAGTPAIAEGIGLGAAVDYLESVGMEN